jgi:hypothetical protein
MVLQVLFCSVLRSVVAAAREVLLLLECCSYDVRNAFRWLSNQLMLFARQSRALYYQAIRSVTTMANDIFVHGSRDS